MVADNAKNHDKLGEQITLLHKKLDHEIKEVAMKVEHISEDITSAVHKKLEARGDSYFVQMKKQMDEALEDVRAQTRTSLEESQTTVNRREEIRIGKQAAGTSHLSPQNLSFGETPRQERGFGYLPRIHEIPEPNNQFEQGREDEIAESEFEVRNERPRNQCNRDQVDDDLSSIKVNIPPFLGTNDPNEYLEWKSKCEMIFSCHTYSR